MMKSPIETADGPEMILDEKEMKQVLLYGPADTGSNDDLVSSSSDDDGVNDNIVDDNDNNDDDVCMLREVVEKKKKRDYDDDGCGDGETEITSVASSHDIDSRWSSFDIDETDIDADADVGCYMDNINDNDYDDTDETDECGFYLVQSCTKTIPVRYAGIIHEFNESKKRRNHRNSDNGNGVAAAAGSGGSSSGIGIGIGVGIGGGFVRRGGLSGRRRRRISEMSTSWVPSPLVQQTFSELYASDPSVIASTTTSRGQSSSPPLSRSTRSPTSRWVNRRPNRVVAVGNRNRSGNGNGVGIFRKRIRRNSNC